MTELGSVAGSSKRLRCVFAQNKKREKNQTRSSCGKTSVSVSANDTVPKAMRDGYKRGCQGTG